MSDTPRTDRAAMSCQHIEGQAYAVATMSRTLERENATLRAEIKHGWDTARESDKEYRRIHALLVGARETLSYIGDMPHHDQDDANRLRNLAKHAALALDITTRLPAK